MICTFLMSWVPGERQRSRGPKPRSTTQGWKAQGSRSETSSLGGKPTWVQQTFKEILERPGEGQSLKGNGSEASRIEAGWSQAPHHRSTRSTEQDNKKQIPAERTCRCVQTSERKRGMEVSREGETDRQRQRHRGRGEWQTAGEDLQQPRARLQMSDWQQQMLFNCGIISLKQSLKHNCQSRNPHPVRVRVT